MVEAPSLYAAYKPGPFWGNAVATYGLFQDKTARHAALDIFTDQNNANTTEQSLAPVLRGSGDLRGMLLGGLSVVFLNPQVISYGGDLDLNVSF